MTDAEAGVRHTPGHDRDFPKLIAFNLVVGAGVIGGWAHDGDKWGLIIGLSCLTWSIAGIAVSILLASTPPHGGTDDR